MTTTNFANIKLHKNEQNANASKNKRGGTPPTSRHTVAPHLFSSCTQI